MQGPILVVMAAGIGSRYGGLKQTDPVGGDGELIIDFSVYDAIQAGFKKVIFIINKKIEEDFKNIIGNRLSKHLEVDYAYQSLSDVPKGVEIPEGRHKPLGTAHAIYAARELIDAPFAVINADDYYGADAFAKIYHYLRGCSSNGYEYAMVGYRLENTVTENGYVSRGVCTTDPTSYLQEIVERTHIEQRGTKIAYQEDNQWHNLNEATIVSMNMWGFTKTFVEEIRETMKAFLNQALVDNPLKCEFYLPYVVDQMLGEKKASVKVLQTDEKWYGVTYSEDKEMVIKALEAMVQSGKYPKKLWGNDHGHNS